MLYRSSATGQALRAFIGTAGALLACSVLASPAPSATGYIRLHDGTQLAYALWLPASGGPFPVLLDYDPYLGGSAQNVLAGAGWDQAGYALLGVNVRGTGCSSGAFDAIDGETTGKDGAAIIDWAAHQPWSNGNIGMLGASFGAETQIVTAAFSGPALKAIAPFANGTDLYRDLIYPGGIYNRPYIELWATTDQPGLSAKAANPSDPICMSNRVQSSASNALVNLAVAAPQHPFFDGYYSRQPSADIGRVDIPMLACTNWQDIILSSREFSTVLTELLPSRTWLLASNGLHTACIPPLGFMRNFFDHFLKASDNGFESQPHLVVSHEVSTQNMAAPTAVTTGTPAWVTRYESLAAPVQPLTLRLHHQNLMSLDRADTPELPDSYTYPAPSRNTYFTWTASADPGTSLTYSTPPLASDMEFLGPASADLWMASTATDTDVQLTLSELRPDGQEMYVQQGYLRLSHRALDLRRSDALRPFHTHLENDAQPLIPGQPTRIRIEIQPFNHVFRAGSSIRLSIDTPSTLSYLDLPAVNSVFYGGSTDSVLRLGWIPGGKALTGLSSCDATAGQPCRPNADPLPAGILTAPIPTATPSTADGGGGSMDEPTELILLCVAICALLARLSKRTK